MPIRGLLLSLGLLAAVVAYAPSARAANTKPRPTYIRPPPSARWVPKEYVDPCTWHWPRYDQYGGSGGGGGGGGGGGWRKKPLERYGNEDGSPVLTAPQQKYTEEHVQKMEQEAAKDDGKPEWTEQTGEQKIETREDTKTKKAGDYLSQTNALQDTRDAVTAKLAEKMEASRGGATVFGPRAVNVPVETSTPAAGPPTTTSPGEQYVIVPREE